MSATATFNISSSTPQGTATVTLTNPAGSTYTGFVIGTTALSKEYIYLGGRVLATEAP